MAFNISEFTGALTGDGARPNLFQVDFKGILGGQKLSFTCKAAQLPGATIGVIEVPYFGRAVKFAGNRTFAEWTITVINDEDFLVRNSIEQWMDGINSHQGNIAADQFGGYSFDADVIQYGKNGDPLKSYTFTNMWPTDLAAIDLDWSSNDTMEEFQVTFAYSHWISDTTS